MALSLDDIIDIKINITRATTTGRNFDLLLLIGKTNVFSDRIKIYKDTYSMLQDGFLTTDRIYKAGELIFSQSQHPDRIAVGRIDEVIEANIADEGEILLADAKELNANAEVGKYIYHFVQVAIDEYRLSDTPVEGGQLIVSDTIPSDEILISDALTLNPNAEVGKYIYQGYALSDTAETDYLEIVEDNPSTGEISLADAQALNPDAEVGKYIAENSSYLLSDTQVTGSQLIVSAYPHDDSEITLTDAQELNSNAEVGKYIYHYTQPAIDEYRLSDSEVEDSQLIISDTITRDETVEEVLRACRIANDEWYVVNFCKEMTDDEHKIAGQFCEVCNPSAIYAFTTNDSMALTINENIFSKLKVLNLQRTIGQYSTQHPDSIVAILSWGLKLLSLNILNNAFTLKDKIEVGVTPEPSLVSSNVKALKDHNGNIYVNRNGFTLFEDGKMANGDFFDEIAFLDKYKERMQANIIKEMQRSNKIKQTEDGMAIIKAKITEVCEDMYASGFIDSGIWKAEPVLNLQTGDTLPNGYYVQSEPIDEQSQEDREARLAPPIYVSLKLAGAIHYLTIQIDVNK